MKKQQKQILFAIVIFLTAGLLIAYYLSLQITKLRPRAAEDKVVFTLQPSKTNPEPGEEVTVALFASPPSSTQTVRFVRTLGAYLKYDSQIEILEVTPSNQAPFDSWTFIEAQDKKDLSRIEITGGYFVPTGQKPDPSKYLTETKQLATIRLKWLGGDPGTIKVSLDPDAASSAFDANGKEIAIQETTALYFPAMETSPSPEPSLTPKTSPALSPTPSINPIKVALYLSPNSKTVSSGDNFDVKIFLNTGGKNVTGVDAILNYDQELLEFVSPVKEGSISAFANKYIIKDDEPGRISVSALISPDTSVIQTSEAGENQTPVNGQELEFATLTFKALPVYSVGAGTESIQTNIAFQFTLGDKNDSNIAGLDENNDLLDTVFGGTYTINPQTTPETALKLKLSVCDQPNNKAVYIKIPDSGTVLETILKSDNTTNPVKIPSDTTKITVRVAGYLAHTFDISNKFIQGELLDLTEFALLAGDLDGSGMINAHDYNAFKLAYNSTDIPADFDCSKKVNALDFEVGLRRNWNMCTEEVDNASCRR